MLTRTIPLILPAREYWNNYDRSRRRLVRGVCGPYGRLLLIILLAVAMPAPGRKQAMLVSGYSLYDLAAQLGWRLDTLKWYISALLALKILECVDEQGYQPERPER